MKHILCFGDSNTWGFVPGTGERYDEHTRWTGVLQDLLGDGFRVHEEGLNGRETVFSDNPLRDGMCGLDALPIALHSQKPLDLLILSLGTNDLKRRTADEAARGVGRLAGYALCADTIVMTKSKVWKESPRILVVSPIAVGEGEWPDDSLSGKARESLRFPELFRNICESYHVEMLDAQRFAEPSAIDRIHMMPEGHRALGEAIAEKVKEMFSEAGKGNEHG